MDDIDIVERLRKRVKCPKSLKALLEEAAHEIEELRALVLVYKEEK